MCKTRWAASFFVLFVFSIGSEWKQKVKCSRWWSCNRWFFTVLFYKHMFLSLAAKCGRTTLQQKGFGLGSCCILTLNIGTCWAMHAEVAWHSAVHMIERHANRHTLLHFSSLRGNSTRGLLRNGLKKHRRPRRWQVGDRPRVRCGRAGRYEPGVEGLWTALDSPSKPFSALENTRHA